MWQMLFGVVACFSAGGSVQFGGSGLKACYARDLIFVLNRVAMRDLLFHMHHVVGLIVCAVMRAWALVS
jgi:hypothetical protein